MPSFIRTRTEFAVNSFTFGNQAGPAVSAFADGGFVVTWSTSDTAQDGSSTAIKAQLFDSAGSKVGTEFLVNEDGSGNQFSSTVTTLDDGRFVVTWVSSASQDGNDGIRARLFDQHGSPIGDEFAVNTTASVGKFTPNVAKLANGGFVISWDDWGGFDTKARIFDSAGVPAGGEFRLNTNTDYFQEYGDIVGLAGGGFVATWRTSDAVADGSGDAVIAQVFSATGTKVGAEFVVNSQKADTQNSPSVAALAGGGFVITWYNADSAQDGSGSAIKAQRFSASGAKVGGEVLVNTQATEFQTDPSVTATPDGGFTIAWTTRHTAQDGSSTAIKAQSFDQNGAKVGGEILVNTLAGGAQTGADLATLADGRVVVTWQSETGDIDGNSVRGQILGTELAPPQPNMRPIVISNGGGTSVTLEHDEGVIDITRVVASDDGEPNNLRYSIAPGDDSHLFRIDPFTGLLRWTQTPQFDPNGSNSYTVTVNASDGQLSGSQSISISVNDVNYVTIVSDGGWDWADLWIDENQTGVTIVSAVDDDGVPLTYSISGGEDAALFTIDAQTGVFNFIAAPDYEQPGDRWGQNAYDVRVTATDGIRSDSQNIRIFIQDVEEAPGFAITSDGGGDHGSISMDENLTAVTAVTTQGAAGAVTYQIVGGDDAGYFQIDANSGELSFVDPVDAEEAGVTRGDNDFDLVVEASDGVSFDQQHLTVHVQDVDEAPELHSYWGEANVALTTTEGYSWVGYIAAGDPDRYSWVTYGISGGADAGLFAVDPYSGEIVFADSQGPDFEAPADADGDNVYEVAVTAYSGMLSATQSFSITVEDAYEYSNEAPTILSNGGGDSAWIDHDEGRELVTTVVAVDSDGPDPVRYSIMGGVSANLFAIDAVTGELFFRQAPDYENPTGGSGNLYAVWVGADDGVSASAQLIRVTVTNVYEDVRFDAPSSAFSIDENLLTVGAVSARGEPGLELHYSLMHSGDGAFFQIDGETGEISFRAAPDFENAQDSGWDNVYNLTVRVTDGTTSAFQSVAVTVREVDEPVEIVSYGGADSVSLSLPEAGYWHIGFVKAEDDESGFGNPIVYSITGGADAALFDVNAYSGELRFDYDLAPDFENPSDADGDNVYEVVVTASSATSTDSQAFAVTLLNRNEGVWITSNGDSWPPTVRMGENGQAVTIVTVRDPDGTVPTFLIAGGADAARFTIDAQTGALSFIDAPDFEAPGDAGADNVYNVTVAASDGEETDTQELRVIVGNVDEVPEFFDYQGTATHQLSMSENGAFVADLLAYDPDAGSEPIRYSIVGGADRDLFRIDAQTGRLTLLDPSGPNFEEPTDLGRDNVYDVEVGASSGALGRIQAFAVTVVNANEPLTILSPAAVTVTEGEGTYVTRVAGHDIDGTFPTYSIVGGADWARFTLDAGTGVLRFVATPDFEAPTDLGGDNVYMVEVAATDGEFTSTQTMQITVRNVAERVTVTSYGGADSVTLNLPENGTAAALVQAVDPDGSRILYSLSGEDSALFAIDSETGALRFVGSPNFEAPADVDGNNSYLVTVVATDETSSDTQAFRINIGNVDEAAVITSNGGGASAAVSVGENGLGVTKVVAVDPEGAQVTYSIAGGADAPRFTIDAATGALAFVAAPDFEAPADSGGNNVYDVIVSASAGSSVDTQALAVTVSNVNEAPAIISNGGGATASVAVAENSRGVTTVAALDPDGTSAGYSIVGGADAARFTIDAQTGLLQFVAAPDWEAPADSNGDNVYSVVVQASDGPETDRQILSVTVLNQRDGANVTGTTGGDSISGTSSNPALRTTNSEDTVSGRDGHDTILGLGGDDILTGDGGNDVLNGGMGADRLTGGLGKDQFVYNAAGESAPGAHDVITDFSRAQADRISLSGIDANTGLSGNQAFTFIGAAAFSGVAGQLRYATSGGVTLVSGDVNGDGVADFQLELTGTLAPVASDFVL
ncbi:MAG TPA: cadherin domain-containing protein [Allosphingosinicella sp.]|jgi:hypothetical protein